MNALLPHSISLSAEKYPDRIAFKYLGESLTYSQLLIKINQLANTLVANGLQKGDRVAVYLNRNLETAIAIYGIMQAGGVYVPVDPKSPIDRCAFLINDCNIKILISEEKLKRNLPTIIKSAPFLDLVIGIEGDYNVKNISWKKVEEQDTELSLPYTILGDDLAYIIYTSGSTGAPKGIMHTHNSGLAYARLSAELYNVSEQDIVANHAALHFDISTFGYLTAPLVGACTVIVSDGHTIFPASLAKLIHEEKISIWYSVPLVLIQMLEQGALDTYSMDHLRWVLYGGEVFPIVHLKKLMKLWSKTRFCNVYGPAEVNQCTYFHIDNIDLYDETIPLGYIWDKTEYLIIDQDEHIVEEGELLIRSITQMKGYWKNISLTEKSLFKVDKDGVIKYYYRTGDIVRKDKNGILHFLSRKDFQVKIRGHRVELTSVEACLLEYPEIIEAAVYPIQFSVSAKRVEAAIKTKDSTSIDFTDLAAYLKQKLPYYAIPEKIIELDEFPRTSTGKIRKSELIKKYEK
jgi:amino acid adenylation domain-containing protein